MHYSVGGILQPSYSPKRSSALGPLLPFSDTDLIGHLMPNGIRKRETSREVATIVVVAHGEYIKLEPEGGTRFGFGVYPVFGKSI